MNSEDSEEISLSELLENLNPLARNSRKICQNVFYNPNETDFLKILQTLQFQCEQENEKLNKLRSLTEYFQQQNLEIEENKKKIALLITEERLLDQEIEKQKQYRQSANAKIRVLGELSTRKHIHETVRQYKKALPQLNREVRDAKEQITREREILNESNIIHKILSERLEQLADQPVTQESEICSNDLQENLERVQKTLNELTKELTKFVEQNFEKKRMAVDSDEDSDNEQRMSSLKMILEDLMDRTFSDPDNPYMRIDTETVWPPYVGMLIRAGIAQRHPDDTNLIKLIEFHM